jgi:hypothetical protein
MHWAIWDAMFKAQNAFEGVIANYPNKFFAWLLHLIVFPLGRPYEVPSDRLGHDVASLMIEPSATRDRLTRDMFIAKAADDPLALIETALLSTIAADTIEAKVRSGVKAGTVTGDTNEARVASALAAGLITPADAETIAAAKVDADRVIHVDDFAPKCGRRRKRGGADGAGEGGMSAAGSSHGARGEHASAPIYVIDGARTPFLKARNQPGPFSASDLSVAAGRTLLLRQKFEPSQLDEVILGCASPSADEVNIGRVVALRMGCGLKVPGWTVMRNCASGMQALDSAIQNIREGRSQLVLAGGVDAAVARAAALQRQDGAVVRALRRREIDRAKAASFLSLNPSQAIAPVIGIMRGLTDPVVGLMMGQTAENLAYRFGITREEMDAFSVRSTSASPRRRTRGHLAGEIVPLLRRQGNRLCGRRRRPPRFVAGEPGQAEAILRPQVRQRHRRKLVADHRWRHVAVLASEQAVKAIRSAGARAGSSIRSGPGSIRPRWD